MSAGRLTLSLRIASLSITRQHYGTVLSEKNTTSTPPEEPPHSSDADTTRSDTLTHVRYLDFWSVFYTIGLDTPPALLSLLGIFQHESEHSHAEGSTGVAGEESTISSVSVGGNSIGGRSLTIDDPSLTLTVRGTDISIPHIASIYTH